MKNRIKLVTMVMIVVSFMLISVYGTNVNITVNGQPYNMYDVSQGIETPAFISNSRTLMPLRKTFEIFGVTPSWNSEERSITAIYGEQTIWLQIDNINAKVNGETVVLDVPAIIKNNRTYVPLRFITETFGITPTWDNDTKTVGITMNGVYLPDLELNLKVGAAFSSPIIINNLYEINSLESYNKVIYASSKPGSFQENVEFYLGQYDFESDQIRSYILRPTFTVYKVIYNDINSEDTNNIYFIDYGEKHSIIHFINTTEIESDRIISESLN